MRKIDTSNSATHALQSGKQFVSDLEVEATYRIPAKTLRNMRVLGRGHAIGSSTQPFVIKSAMSRPGSNRCLLVAKASRRQR